MNKFRPQEVSKVSVMKQRLKYGRTDNYNWQTRTKWVPAGYTKNQNFYLAPMATDSSLCKSCTSLCPALESC